MENICNYSIEELEKIIEEKNGKKYNAKSIYDFIYKKRINSFDEITNVKKEIVDYFKSNYEIIGINLLEVQESKDTKKFLFNLKDNNKIEAVIMKHNYGNSVCISSQVGCNMGCSFCESGRLKKVRDLEPYEMVNQILLVNDYLNKEKITHVVVMGIGEPFDNYDNVLKAMKIINSPFGLEIGARHITISTCGVIPGIKKFMEEKEQFNLAISLHSADDIKRSELMKINKVYNIKELIKTIDEYIEKTNRRVTIEYILIKDENDSLDDAQKLYELLKYKNIYINLIPYNETSEFNYKKPNKDEILKFYDYLKTKNINVTIRREYGDNIDAACGQLSAKYGEE